MRRIQVNGYSEEWLKKRFPWVYPKEVVGAPPKRGEGVVLVGAGGVVLGRGIGDDGWIAARVFRHDDGPVDREWLGAALDAAKAYRDRVLPPNTTGYRLVHGENDGLPGVRIDVWSHAVVIALDSPSLAGLLDGLVEHLKRLVDPRAIYLCYRKDSRDERDAARFTPAPGLIHGHPLPADVTVLERGLRLRVRPWEGPDVGSYADMRDVRAWLEPHWGGRAVLNTFAYTGAFSVAAALGGASEIATVDLSGPYLERGAENFRANDLDPERFEWFEEDTFAALDRFRRQGRVFDVVILDPPSFSHTKEGGTWSVKKDTPRLVAAAARVLAPDGWIVAASNHGETSPRDFRTAVSQGFQRAGRLAQEVAWLGAAPDFPASLVFPEAHYLKVGVYRGFAT
jgi:23S rRNA (cytosine1962-C5)-methyltransferase